MNRITQSLSFAKRYLLPIQHHSLLKQFAQRDILSRYRGSFFGIGWALLTPLLMLAVYVFAFRVVFNARWPGAEDSTLEFALQVYAGLVVYGMFAETSNRAPRLMIEHTNLIKKVLFPLEIISWSVVLTGLFHTFLSLVVLLITNWAVNHTFSLSIIALPLVLGPMVPLSIGLVWLISALGTYIRDINQVVNLIVSLMVFVSPVFFPLSALPEQWQPLLALNPLAPIIEQTRQVVLEGAWPDWGTIGMMWLTALVVAIAGAYIFHLLRRGFADVL
ncbi:MAG: ABC transporter permease [Thiotrichales bacterium]|nr:ABC transporter permease [Thiotrichales bacterium]